MNYENRTIEKKADLDEKKRKILRREWSEMKVL